MNNISYNPIYIENILKDVLNELNQGKKLSIQLLTQFKFIRDLILRDDFYYKENNKKIVELYIKVIEKKDFKRDFSTIHCFLKQMRVELNKCQELKKELLLKFNFVKETIDSGEFHNNETILKLYNEVGKKKINLEKYINKNKAIGKLNIMIDVLSNLDTLTDDNVKIVEKNLEEIVQSTNKNSKHITPLIKKIKQLINEKHNSSIPQTRVNNYMAPDSPIIGNTTPTLSPGMEALLNEVLQPALHQPFALPPPALPAQYQPHLQSQFATARRHPQARRHTYSSSSPFLSSDELKRVFDSPPHPSSHPPSGKRSAGPPPSSQPSGKRSSMAGALSQNSNQLNIYKLILKAAVNASKKLDQKTWEEINDYYHDRNNNFKQDKEFEDYLKATNPNPNPDPEEEWKKFLNFDNAFGGGGINYKYKKYTDFMRKHKHVRAWLSKVKSASHYKQKLRHVRSFIFH
jgi:hypothetical protein